MRCIFFRLGTGNRFRIRCKSRRKHLEPDAGRRSQVQSGGVFVASRTCNWFAVSADVLYSRQGSKIKDSDVKLRTDYLNIPVLANFYLTRGMALKAGVQPGFLLAAKAKEGDVKVDVKEMYKTFDLSIPVGLSYDFKFGLILDARYNIGVTNLAKDAGCTRNSVFAVTAGWRF